MVYAISTKPRREKGFRRTYEKGVPSTKEAMRIQANADRLKSRVSAFAAGRMGLMGTPNYNALTRQIPRGFVGARGDAKFVDTAVATYANNTTGSITHISIIPQGDNINSRDGKACRATSVNVRGVMAVDTTTTVTTIANYLVWDYQPNKALAVITDVFDTANALSFPRRENNARFKIIKKWFLCMSGNATTPATGLEVAPLDDYVRLPIDANILYTAGDTTGVIGDTIQGALLFISLGSAAAGTTDGNTTAGFRLNFTDQLT